MNILIVEARYHLHVAQMLLDGATAALDKGDVHFERVAVPGVLEIPPAIALAQSAPLRPSLAREPSTGSPPFAALRAPGEGAKPFDGYVALGCVLGADALADTLYRETTRALLCLGLQGLAIGQGVVLAADEADALALAREGDAGGDAARACLALATLRERAGYLR